jgi:hypothetical protein
MAVSISITGNKQVGTLRKEFTLAFPYIYIRVYKMDGKTQVGNDGNISKVRSKVNTEELNIVGNLHVGTFEKRVEDLYGFKVQVYYEKGDKHVKSKDEQDNMTLSGLNDWAKENGYDDVTAWAKTL